MQENSFGFAHLWNSGDLISHSTAIILALMSISSWYIVSVKLMEWYLLRKAAKLVVSFWAASGYDEGLARLGKDTPYLHLAKQARHCKHTCETAHDQLASRFNLSEQLELVLRQQLSTTQAEMENGLTLLATTGATAPFIGLFGTVWGIYHALVAIRISGQAALEKIAGPVGEALIMTAAGPAVALPAVFAYNAFTRANRVMLADMDAFAHDLHAFFTMGKPTVAQSAQIYPTQRRAAAGGI